MYGLLGVALACELPSLERLQKDYKNMDIVFLSISVDTDKEAWEKMLTEDQLDGVQLWADGWSQLPNHMQFLEFQGLCWWIDLVN